MRALLAGVAVASAAGALGCFVVWRRMAYFGDSIAHAALLGAAVGLVLGIGINIAVAAVCVLFALLLAFLRQKKIFAADTLMGIMAHTALALGVIAVSAADKRFDLHSYLFGDILLLAAADVWRLLAVCFVSLSLLAWHWKSLALLAAHEDLAASEGVHPLKMNALLMLLMAITVAMSVQVVGVLLVGGLLIIPAAAARQFSPTPAKMALLSALFGALSVMAGMLASLHFDLPAGPCIVASAAALFTLLLPFSSRQ